MSSKTRPWRTVDIEQAFEAPKLTKAQREYLRHARKGVLAVGNKLPVAMQRKLANDGLITRDHYGYFVLTDKGSEALDA